MYVNTNLPKMVFPEARTIMTQEMIPSRTEIGEVLPNWIDTGVTINGEIWALRGLSRYGSRYSEVGITEKSTHKLFTTDTVASNIRLTVDGETYLTGYQQSWGTHNEVILEMIF